MKGIAWGEAAPEQRVGHLARGSFALTVNVGLNALGGLLFWALAARLHPESAVGGASALLQWTFLINLVASLGLPIALARFAPDDTGESARLFSFTLLCIIVSSFVGSAALVLLAGDEVIGPLSGFGRLGAFLIVGVLVAGMSFALLGETRLLTLRRWGWVVVRVAVLVVVRLLLVPIDPTADPATWLYLLAVGAPAASGFVTVAGLLWSGRPAAFARPRISRPYVRFATANWWVMVATQGLAFAVPAVVSLQVNNDEFASFYVVWSVAAIIFLVPQMIGQVQLTEGSKTGARVSSQGVQAVMLAAAFAVVATVIATLGRGALSLIYGPEYADAEKLMPILCAASIPWAVTTTTISLLRIQHRMRALALLAAAFAGVTIPLAFILTGRLGIEGGAWAWLIGHSVGACFALGPLVGLIRHSHSEHKLGSTSSGPIPSAPLLESALADHQYAVPAQDLT